MNRLQICDYERIEALAQKLTHARLEVRSRSAANILFKLKNGIFEADILVRTNCLSVLLDCIHEGIYKLLQDAPDDMLINGKEANHLLAQMLEIVRCVGMKSDTLLSIDKYSQILDKLYFISNLPNLDSRSSKFVNESIEVICGVERSLASAKNLTQMEVSSVVNMAQAAVADTNFTSRLTGAMATASSAQHLRATKLAAFTSQSSQQASRSLKPSPPQLQGAGAILGTWLVYTGWKFPHCVVVDADDRFIFDVEVKLKMRHPEAVKDIWDLLSHFPPQALLTKPSLLHAVLDLVGSPVSQTDIDNDLLGLHPITALKWLEALMRKSIKATEQLLDGRFSARVPAAPKRWAENPNEIDEAADLASKLARAMYELRHPRAAAPLNSSDSAFGDEFIPDDSPAEILRNQRTAAAMGALALVPNPSLPGLAFACCAAALPLLQTNNTLVAAAVHSLLSVCLPYVVEPKIVSLATKWGEEDRPPLSSVEYGRLQHLLNRVEQLLVFLETPFQIEKYHSFIFSVDVGATESQSMRDQLSAGSDLAFEVVIVSVVQLLFDVIPVRSLLSMQQPDTGAEGLKLAVGAQTFTLLSTVCAMHENFRGSILKIRNDEQIHDDTNENAVKRLFAEQLEVLDSTLFNQIMQLKSMLACATSLASHQLQKSGCGSLMSIVNNVAECIGILDKHSIVTAAQSAICRALPVLLLACCGEGTCDDTERDYCINTVANLILRTVCCSKCDTQSLLVERLYCWIAHSYDIIPNALAMGSGRMNAKDAVVNDISDEMCAELKNRFSISDFEWNMLLVLQPCPSSGRKALSVLASPVLLRAVILLHGQLQANPTNENESFLLLVELICSSLMGDNLSLAQLDEWSTYCLLPLKALEWEQAENEDTGTATKVRTQGTIAFARRLQDHCADSRNPAVSRLFSKIMIAGLFHRNRSVRISSSLRVRRDLLRTSTSADARDADAHGMAAVHFDQRGAELHSYDSFPSSGLLRLVRWPFDGYAVHNRSSTVDGSGLVKAKVPSGKRKGKKVTSALVGGTFSHAELQKLAAIAFGELEHKIKATAMNQMLHMLTGDIHLLTSAHLQWLHGIASGACSYLEEFITFTESRSPLFVSIDTEKLKRSDESSLWLLRESIQLLAFLVLAEPRLRNLATFRRPESDASSQLQLSLLPVLKIFVCSSRINISTEMQLHPAAYETVKLLSTVSAQILSMMACQCEDWTVFPFADECDNIINCTFISTKRSSSDAEESAQVQDVDGSEPRYLVRIPASLVRNFYFASPVDYHSGDSAVYVSPESLAPSAWVTIMASTSFEVVQLECTSADAVVFPPPEIARALEHDAFHPIATESVHVAFATKVFELLANASNHSELRQVLAMFRCFLAANSSLFEVFSHLKISLLAALSHIFTGPPQTLKDNVTLCHTLQFMSCMFETLSSTSSDSTSIAADVLCMLNDAIAAIVEPMALFLQESYSGSILHSNISNDASALDTSKASLRRAVSVSYLQLLFVLSGYHMNLRVLLPLAAQSTPSPRVRLSEIMDGHRLVAILLQASTSEILSAHERSFAAGIISNLLSFHNGLYLMNSIEQGNFTKSYVFQGIEYRNLGVLDCMIKSIRLLRTPDSMVGTAGVVGSLRILLLCLKQHEQNGTVRHAMQEAAEAQSGGSGSGSSPRSAWHWLARVMYDRRSEVKVLAMKIFMMVLKYGQSKNDKRAAANAFDMTEDSLQGQLQQDQHEERIGGAETGGDEADEAVEQWPPLDMIVQVMCDSTESFALRCCALEIMVQIAAQQSSGECRVNLGAIISSVFDLLTLRDELAGPLTMEMAMSSLLALYQWSVQSQQERYFMQLLRSMKVLPVMIDILNPGLLFISLQRGMQRMQMDTSELMKNHSVGNDDPAVVPIVMAAGWNHMSKAFFKTSRTALLNCRKQVSCFLLGISTTAAPCFAECVDRTRLIPNSLISLITLLSNPRYICSSPGAVQMYFASVESASDMLSLIIGNESLGTGDDAAVAVAASASAEGSMPLQTAGRPMSQFVIENCLLPEQLLCAMKSFFLWAAAARRGASNHSSVRGMSAVLRLLTVIVNDDLWRSYLRFGGQSGFSEMDENAKDLFCTLLATQRSLVHENGAKSEMEAGDAIVAHRLNCCLAAIVQYSAAARSLLTKAFLESSAPCSKSNAVMGDARVEFLRVHFDCIRMAAERLVKGSCESGHDGAMQSSLRDLKNKTTATKAGAGAGRGAKGSSDGAEKGSTPSPWARKPTTTGKWRDKTRSYKWNDGGSVGTNGTAARVTGKAADLPRNMKLPLWSALTLLSQLLPKNSMLVKFAVDQKLHEHIVTLLRFAGASSLEATLSAAPYAFDFAVTEQWLPSRGQIAASIYSCCCALIAGSSLSKSKLAAAGKTDVATIVEESSKSPPKTATLSRYQNNGARKTAAAGSSAGVTDSNTSTTTIHQLLSMGLSRGTVGSARWISFAMAGAILAGGGRLMGAASLKATVAQITALALQKSMHSSTAEPAAVPHLVNLMTALLCTEDGAEGCVRLSRANVSQNAAALLNFQLSVGLITDAAAARAHDAANDDAAHHRFASTAAVDSVAGATQGSRAANSSTVLNCGFELVTFPELMAWVWNSHGAKRSEVAAALCRCLGHVPAKLLTVGADSGGGATEGQEAQAATAAAAAAAVVARNRQYAAHLLTQDLVEILCAACSYPQHEFVAELAELALWNASHHSEKVKSHMKAIARN